MKRDGRADACAMADAFGLTIVTNAQVEAEAWRGSGVESDSETESPGVTSGSDATQRWQASKRYSPRGIGALGLQCEYMNCLGILNS